MTPQLQQAIKLLQLSTLDLQLEIQEAIESNPLLELVEDETYENQQEADPEDFQAAAEPTVQIDNSAETSLGEQLQTETIPEDLPVDTNWDDIYPSLPASGSANNSEEYSQDFRPAASETLQEHLMWQLNLTPMSDTDHLIALSLIDGIDTDGMLTVSLEDILTSFDPEMEIELDEIQAVLTRIQHFDPVGVAARDLRECLLLQLKQLSADTPYVSESIIIVEEHLGLLASRDFNSLKRKTRWDQPTLQYAISVIQSLNPRPGSAISADETEYIVPDVSVTKIKGRWVVELNAEATPKLGINATYANMIKRADKSSDNTFLKNNLQEARWFLKSLQSRNETLLKVATRIVEHQKGFFEYGEEAMQPLVLHDIAEAVEMHESTISRVTNRKYMHTPRGIFELKYFFSSHVGTKNGGEVSSTAIRALIKKLTADENPKKPLSDSKIAIILGEQSINVARRTVAKYRESMSIPPSNERKRLV